MISFYNISEKLCLKRKGLFEERKISLTKKEYGFADS